MRLRVALAFVLFGLAVGSCRDSPRPEVAGDEVAGDALRAGYLAKRLCSGLWVNHRGREEFLAHDILLAAEALDRVTLEEDDAARRVTARTRDGFTITAVFHPTHGCTLLPAGAADVSFDPSPIESALPPAETTPWPMGDVDPRDLPGGIDRLALRAAVESAFAEDPAHSIHTRAFLAVYRGQVIAERYAAGFDRKSVQIGWSMGKSITSALIGIAVAKGWLALDQPAPIAAWRAPGDPRGGIRIRDLLQMSSGLDFVRLEPDDPDFFSTRNHHFLGYFAAIDVFALATGRPARDPPGTAGRYRNGDPLALAGILREAVEAHGGDFLTFPQEELFDRIGVRSMVLERDVDGNMILTGFDHATARDWARFGLLHLQDGLWQGRRILPEGWVKFVSSPAPAWPEGNYGGLFWLNGAGALPGAPRDAFYAAGAFGQFVVILPSNDLVVVRMGYSAEGAATRKSLGEAIGKLIQALPRGHPAGQGLPATSRPGHGKDSVW